MQLYPGVGLRNLLALYPAWQRTAHWARMYRAHRQLYPLWFAVREITPEIALDPSTSEFHDWLRFRDLDFRLYPRVIEIRDGRLALRPFLDADVARHAQEELVRDGLEGYELDAAVEARVLADGIRNARQQRLPADILTTSEQGGKDFMSEVEWLLRVVRTPPPTDPSTHRSSAKPPGHLEAGPV